VFLFLFDRQAPARHYSDLLGFPKVIFTAIICLPPVTDCKISRTRGKDAKLAESRAGTYLSSGK